MTLLKSWTAGYADGHVSKRSNGNSLHFSNYLRLLNWQFAGAIQKPLVRRGLFYGRDE